MLPASQLTHTSAGELSSVAGLVRRLIPAQAHKFVLQMVPVESATTTAYFQLDSVTCVHQGHELTDCLVAEDMATCQALLGIDPTASPDCVLITGSDPVAIASGFNWYLKYTGSAVGACHTHRIDVH